MAGYIKLLVNKNKTNSIFKNNSVIGTCNSKKKNTN